MGYGNERGFETPKLEGTGPGADPVHAIGPKSSRGKTLSGFGKLFGLQDIYDGDEEHVRGGAEQDESSGSTNEMEKKWQDQVDGLSAKWRKGVKKAVHFGGVRRIPEKNEGAEKLEEKAVGTLSLSVQVPTAGGKAMGEKGWREQSSMSQLFEKLRRAAELFAVPNAEDGGVPGREGSGG